MSRQELNSGRYVFGALASSRAAGHVAEGRAAAAAHDGHRRVAREPRTRAELALRTAAEGEQRGVAGEDLRAGASKCWSWSCARFTAV